MEQKFHAGHLNGSTTTRTRLSLRMHLQEQSTFVLHDEVQISKKFPSSNKVKK